MDSKIMPCTRRYDVILCDKIWLYTINKYLYFFCLEWTLHDWSDDQFSKLLMNCYNALEDSGKVITVDYVIPEFPETDIESKNAFKFDKAMFSANPVEKERTEKEFQALARGARLKL